MQQFHCHFSFYYPKFPFLSSFRRVLLIALAYAFSSYFILSTFSQSSHFQSLEYRILCQQDGYLGGNPSPIDKIPTSEHAQNSCCLGQNTSSDLAISPDLIPFYANLTYQIAVVIGRQFKLSSQLKGAIYFYSRAPPDYFA